MSRLRILLLFAALTALATAFAACGGGGSSSDENPQTVIGDATFQGIENADIDLAVGLEVSGEEGGHVDASLSGPVQGGSEGQLPEFGLAVKSEGSIGGEDADFEGGLTLLPHKAYVNYQGTDYEVDPATFSFVESALNQAQSKGQGESSSPASLECQEATAESLDIGDFVDNLSNEGSADVGGTDTTKISGDLNVPGAIDSVIKISEDPACAAQLESAGPLPIQELNDAQGEIESALKSAKVDVYVGDDNIVRRVVAELTIQPEGEDQSAEIDLDLSLNDVNEGQDISTPDSAAPLNDLFQKLDINPLDLLQATQGGEGLGGLLEGISGATGGSGGSKGSGQSYTECITKAASAADLQACAKKLQ